MWYRSLSLLAIMTILTAVSSAETPAPAPARQPPPPAGRLFFVLQQDLSPAIDRYGFDKGFKYLLKTLPNHILVEVSGFSLNNIYPVLYGKAGDVAWPPERFKFTALNDNTDPFIDILATLVHRQVTHKTVYLISSGRSLKMIREMNLEGLFDSKHVNIKSTVIPGYEKPYILDQRDFDPSKYQPLANLCQYCREKDVRIVGMFIQNTPRHDMFVDDDRTGSSFFTGDMRYYQNDQMTRSLAVDSIGLTSLSWLAHSTGGDIYQDFTTFRGLFDTLLLNELK